MREILSVSVEHELKLKIEQAAKYYNLSQSEIVKRAIKKYLVKKELDELRDLLLPYAEKAGYLTDEDVFKSIS